MRINKPFTLIEILISMAIFLLACAPLLGLMTASTATFHENLRKRQASLLANSILSKYQAFTYGQLANLISTSPNDVFPSVDITSSTNESDQYKGMYYVAIADMETDGLGILRLGVAFKNVSNFGLTSTSFDTSTKVATFTSSNPVVRKRFASSKYIYHQGTSTTSYLLSVTNASVSGTTVTMTLGDMPNAPTGTFYPLDYVFTSWLSENR